MKKIDKAPAKMEEAIQKLPDSEISPQVKKKIADEMDATKKKYGTPLETDEWIYRLVVAFLGSAILACLIFAFFISLKNAQPDVTVEIPEIFLAIGSAAVGALAGLLAPSPGRGESE